MNTNCDTCHAQVIVINPDGEPNLCEDCQDADTCQTCHALIEGGNPFSTQCDTCLDKETN